MDWLRRGGRLYHHSDSKLITSGTNQLLNWPGVWAVVVGERSGMFPG